MYRCEFSKLIWKDIERSEIHDVLVKNLTLPFTPYLGLSVVSGRFKSGEIQAVTWDTEKEVFSVSVKDEIPWEDEDHHSHTAEQITNHLLKRTGWELPE